MAESISKGLADLNRTDLSALMKRLAAARAEAEKALKASGQNPNATATPADIARAAQQAGMTVEQFLALLERARKIT